MDVVGKFLSQMSLRSLQYMYSARVVVVVLGFSIWVFPKIMVSPNHPV